MKNIKNTLSIITLCATSILFGAQPSEKPLEYTIGLKIPNETYAGKPVNPLHMTVTFLGAADSVTLERAKTALQEINKYRPFNIVVGEADTFGTKERPVPVRRLKFQDKDKEQLLINFHREFGVAEPFMPEKLDTPNWHISLKDSKLQEEFTKKEGQVITGGKLFIKPLGPFDPVLELE